MFAKEWSEHFVIQLRKHYGLVEEDAKNKVDSWFQSHEVSGSESQTLTAAVSGVAIPLTR